MPIYRQQEQFKRLGCDIPLNTLYGYWDYAAKLLQPIAEAILSTVLAEDIVAVDDLNTSRLMEQKNAVICGALLATTVLWHSRSPKAGP